MPASASLRFGPFRLDIARGVLIRDGVEVLRERLPIELLTYLLRNPERPVGTDELIDNVWSGTNVQDGSIKNAVHKIRGALGDHAHLLKTHHRRGVEFVGELREERGPTRTEQQLTILANRKELDRPIEKALLASQASQIDMLGWNLHRQWFDDPTFVEALEKRFKGEPKPRLRVLLPARDSAFMQALLRDISSFAEDEETGRKEADESLNRYDDTVARINALPVKGVLHLLEVEAVLCGLVRFDRVMAVSLYTYPHRGREAVSLLLNMNHQDPKEVSPGSGELFDKLRMMFDTLWARCERRRREPPDDP